MAMKVLFWVMIMIPVVNLSLASYGEETGNQQMVEFAYSGILSILFLLIYVFLSGWAVYLFSRKIYHIALGSSSPKAQTDIKTRTSILSRQQRQFSPIGSKFGAYVCFLILCNSHSFSRCH